MHAKVYSGSILGVGGLLVEVEVDLARGVPSFTIVGLANTAVRESRERVTSAVKNSGWRFPLARITVNLAPADVKKEGAAFDLAIAVGLLLCSEQLTAADLSKTLFLGELALDGSLRKVKGVLPLLVHGRSRRFERAFVPKENFSEALAVDGIEVFGCESLEEVVALLGEPSQGALVGGLWKSKEGKRVQVEREGGEEVDMSEVIGQEAAKRAMVVAAAGAHHMLMVGPPGAGKTMLAKRFPTLLPDLTEAAALETTMVYSAVGLLDGMVLVSRPPFRSPHHSASDAGLIGGGNIPRPGEVSLAHNGVLFLDELPEFKRHVLEALREPLEEGRITIARAREAVTFPASFQLIAAMNPCPCGLLGGGKEQCRCTPTQVKRYLGKVSGPLLDRIAIQIFLRPVEMQAFRGGECGTGSSVMREEVVRARRRQEERYRECADRVVWNATAPAKVLKTRTILERAAEDLLLRAQRTLGLSARARSQVIRVARTVADLEGSEAVRASHVAEAVQYRVRSLV